MKVFKFVQLTIFIFSFGTIAPSAARTDPANFFPSVPIHEDDKVTGDYDLERTGCSFVVTKFAPSRKESHSISETMFDLRFYDTTPDHVNAPLFDAPRSSRHTIVWLSSNAPNSELNELQSKLWEARLTFKERGDLMSFTTRQKQRRLKMLLEDIQNEVYGPFAAQNHNVSYRATATDRELVGVSVKTAIRLPVASQDARLLIVEMHKYKLANCKTD